MAESRIFKIMEAPLIVVVWVAISLVLYALYSAKDDMDE
jgi:hypothetical protein